MSNNYVLPTTMATTTREV